MLIVLLSSSDSSTAIQDMVAHVYGPTLFFTAGSAIQICNLRMSVIMDDSIKYVMAMMCVA